MTPPWPPELLPPSPLIGRAGDLAHFHQRLEQPGVRLLSVVGPGGVGKTSLVAQALLERPSSCCAVSLATLEHAPQLLSRLRHSLGVLHPAQDDLSALTAFFSTDTVLFLDNFEQLLNSPQALEALEALLRACTALRVVVTSRRVLGLSGETVLRLEPLALPPLSSTRAKDSLLEPPEAAAGEAESAAVQLFLHEAQRVNPHFAAEVSRPTLVELCRRLDGLPLALSLVARRMDVLSPEAALERLTAGQGIPRPRAGSRPVRQQGLEQTVAWSVNLLSPAQRRLFVQLGLFAGGFSAETVAQLGLMDPPGDTDPSDALEALCALSDDSLLVAQPEQGRFRLLETLRHFAARELERSGDALAWKRTFGRHYGDWLRGLVDTYRTAQAADTLERIGAEYPNVLRGVQCLIEQEPAEALEVLRSLTRYWELSGRFEDGRLLLSGLWAQAQGLGNLARARVLGQRGMVLMRLGRSEEARQDYQQALELLGEGEPLEQAQTRLLLANLQIGHKEYVLALEQLNAAYASLQIHPDPRLLSLVLNSLSATHYHLNDLAQSGRYAEESLALRRSSPLFGEVSVATAQHNLGLIRLKAGQRADGWTRLLESLEIALRCDYRMLVAENLDQIARALSETHPQEAAQVWGRVDAYRAQHALRPAEPDRTEHDAAVRRVRQALEDADDQALHRQGAGYPLELLLERLKGLKFAPTDPPTAPRRVLTLREHEILVLVQQGLTNKAIARDLGLSSHTVMHHLKVMFGKLEVHNRSQLVAVAARLGILGR